MNTITTIIYHSEIVLFVVANLCFWGLIVKATIDGLFNLSK